MKKGFSPVILLIGLVAIAVTVYFLLPRDTYEELKGLEGPQGTTLPGLPANTLDAVLKQAPGTETSRLAVFLTDRESAWTGIQNALETMGIPHVITQDADLALRHKVVLVYPAISGKFVNRDQQNKLRQHVASGGCLLATQVLGGDLKDLFGFAEVVESREHFELTFSENDRLTEDLTHERERTVRLGNPGRSGSWIGTQHYLQPEHVLAGYQDGKAAWISKQHPGGGVAMALGFDLGFYILKCQNDRDEEASRSYVNDYEPSVDVWLRLLKKLYQQHEPLAVTVDTVPDGQKLSAVVSFDVDYVKSMTNMAAYRDLLVKDGLPATFFVQAKYYRDYFDSGFFNDISVGLLRELRQAGMEIASHSVAHSDMFAHLPLGDGKEKYPGYQPRVHGMEDTRDATVLGELRVSKFLLEKLTNTEVKSFRPGFLACPPALPQAMEAAGYRYASSVTAANVMTYLPYRKNYDRQYSAPTSIIEFPVAVEDEHPPAMEQRVESALNLAKQLSTYGGTFTILSHPNVLDHKYRFFEQLLPKLKNMAWVGTLKQLGEWWDARSQLQVDVSLSGSDLVLKIQAPVRARGVTLHVPGTWKAAQPLPPGARLDQGRLFLPETEGTLQLAFREN